MRRINIKVLLILTTVVFLLLGVGGVIWYSNSDRASGVFLKRAQTAEDEGNLREAIDSYLRYLAFRPTDQETKEHAALLAVKSRNSRTLPISRDVGHSDALRACYGVNRIGMT